MVAMSAGFALAFACLATDAGLLDDRVTNLFQSDHYTVEWGAVPFVPNDAELEIGDGLGHGGNLGWMWFKPGKDGVDVLSVKLDTGWNPYKSKHAPDLAPVTVKRACLKSDAYAVLLKELALVESTRAKPWGNEFWNSTSDIWVAARLATDKKTYMDVGWAGFQSAQSMAEYAKTKAAVTLAGKAVEKLEFKKHELTKEEQAWASAKFAREWKRYKEPLAYGWVRARSIVLIGVVGDATAYPTFREILTENKHFIYEAVNAVTRLTGKDVRDKPVEEMDVEKVRPKVLELIRDKK